MFLLLIMSVIAGCVARTTSDEEFVVVRDETITQSNITTHISAQRNDSSQASGVLNDSQESAAGSVSHADVIVEEPSWWKPTPGLSWHWQLDGEINTKYDVDVYDVDLVETPQAVIDALHRRGVKVICYFSAGSWEEFRDDADDFPSRVLGAPLDEWPDERWLDVSRYELFAPVMRKRLDMAVMKGCDGVEPDNVDGYLHRNGFGFSYDDQLRYNKWLASEAHKRNLSVGLKNDLEQVNDLVEVFDFAVNEQCFQYDECDLLLPFIHQGKAVFGVEYELSRDDFCDDALRWNFSWLRASYDLSGETVPCSS